MKILDMGEQKLPLFIRLSLKYEIHYSNEIYVAKKTRYAHVTSKIDLQSYYHVIDSIVVRNCIAHSVSLDFVQQKGSEYDYILFR